MCISGRKEPLRPWACGQCIGSRVSVLDSNPAARYMCVLDKSLNFSEPPVPYLQHRDNSTYLMDLWE